jgi:hypothetical protein
VWNGSNGDLVFLKCSFRQFFFFFFFFDVVPRHATFIVYQFEHIFMNFYRFFL